MSIAYGAECASRELDFYQDFSLYCLSLSMLISKGTTGTQLSLPSSTTGRLSVMAISHPTARNGRKVVDNFMASVKHACQ